MKKILELYVKKDNKLVRFSMHRIFWMVETYSNDLPREGKALQNYLFIHCEESTKQFGKVHFRITVGVQNSGNCGVNSGVKWRSSALVEWH